MGDSPHEVSRWSVLVHLGVVVALGSSFVAGALLVSVFVGPPMGGTPELDTLEQRVGALAALSLLTGITALGIAAATRRPGENRWLVLLAAVAVVLAALVGGADLLCILAKGLRGLGR